MRCRFVVDLHLLNEIFQNLIKKEPQEQQQQQQPTEKFIRKSIILRTKTLFSSVLFLSFFSFICDRSDIFHLACNYANFYHLFTPCFAIVSFNSLEMFLIIFLVLIGTVTLNEINLWFPSIELMIACVCMHVYVCMF